MHVDSSAGLADDRLQEGQHSTRFLAIDAMKDTVWYRVQDNRVEVSRGNKEYRGYPAMKVPMLLCCIQSVSNSRLEE